MSTSKPGNVPPGGSPPNSAPGASSTTAPNSYTRFIPREELGSFSAWAPETFEQPARAANGEDGGVRKPTLAERAAAEMRPPNMKANGARHAPQATGGTAPAASAAAKPAQAKPAPVKRPIVGGVPGETPAEAPGKAAEAPPAPPAPDVEELVREARQTGYQDGYRDGLAALRCRRFAEAAQKFQAARELGYTRMWSIHPAQIRPILAAFAPNEREIERASSIIEAAVHAEWAPIRHDNQLHDRASYRYFWQVIERAHQTGRPSPDTIRPFFSH